MNTQVTQNQEINKQTERNLFVPFLVKFVARGTGDVPAKDNYLVLGVTNEVSDVLKEDGVNISVELFDQNTLVIRFKNSDIDVGGIDNNVLSLIHQKDLIIQIMNQDLKSVGAIALA